MTVTDHHTNGQKPDGTRVRAHFGTGADTSAMMNMMNTERLILADMYYFLRDHATPADEKSWRKAGEDMRELVTGKWVNHPLAMEVGTAIYKYLEVRHDE